MPRNRNALLVLLRAASLGLTLAALVCVDGFGFHGLHSDLVRGIAVLFGVGVLLPRSILLRPVVPLLLLAADLVAVGATGTFLRMPDAAVLPPMASIPFLAGFLVAALVAVTGRRVGAAALGALAGTMLLVLGESVLPHDGTVEAPALGFARGGRVAAVPAEAVDPSGPAESRDVFLAVRLALLAIAALECAVVMGWIDADLRRRRTAQSIDREMRVRDGMAAEMATFVTAASAAASLSDLAEALIQHLRRHVPTRARGIVLEDGVERICRWEEAGCLDDDATERRRLRLQEALREAGSPSVVEKLDARSTSSRALEKSERLLTSVGIPVHSGGRVSGVLFVADPARGVLTEDRIGAIAELARQAGDAVRRLDRARDEQTRRTSILLGQMREGVLLLGPDGRLLISNPAGREMLKGLGQSAKEPIALGDQRPAQLAAVPPGSVQRWAVTAQGQKGAALRFAVAAVGVVDGGTRLGTLVTLSDVTEEEQARRRLMQAEKLSVVGQTLASVAHELNNPLAAIVGYSDLLADAQVPPETERILTRIREQATRTSRIVKNLLNMARRRGPERTRVPLNEVVQSVVDLFAYDARLSNILILPGLDPEAPAVSGDRHALQQVLVNLVQNAIQALKGREGGGRIEIRTGRDRGMAVVGVRDDGPGVPPELRAKVFETFFTTKGPDEGTGLGLAISRGIAREHGGDLVLEPLPAGFPGAQFTLRIPVADAAPARAGEAAAAIPAGVPAHVLVVDDEAPVRESLVEQLARMGAQVDSAATPLEAVRLLAGAAAYDAVLLDLRLPGQSGLDVHRALRARNPELAGKVVFMTGDLVNDELLHAVKATGNALLEKPFTAQELREALSRAQVA